MKTETSIKTEVDSPPRDNSGGNKLGAVDRWRARVFFKNTVSTSSLPSTSQQDEDTKDGPAGGNISWTKMIERKMAVLKVAFPFLTEPQIRGKAWQECGLKSIMGGVPRSGLSLKIKREFTKRSHNYSRASQKVRVKKEPKTEPCPYVFSSPKLNLSKSQSTDASFNTSRDSDIETVTGNANTLDLFQVSDIDQSMNDGSPVPSPRKRVKKVHFADEICEVPTQSSYILPNTPVAGEIRKQESYFERMTEVPTTAMDTDERSTEETSRNNCLSLENIKNINLPLDCQIRIHNSQNPAQTVVINFQDLLDYMNLHPTEKIVFDYSIQPGNDRDPRPTNQRVSDQNKENEQSVVNMIENFFDQNKTGTRANSLYPGETTPLQSVKIDARKKIVYETIEEEACKTLTCTAQVYHGHDDDVVDKPVFQGDRDVSQIKPSQTVPGYNGFSVASCDLDTVEDADEYFKRKNKKENMFLTPIRPIHQSQLNPLKLRDLHFDSDQIRERTDASQNDNLSEGLVFGQKPPIESQDHPEDLNRKMDECAGPVYHHAYDSSDNCSQSFIVSLPLTPADLSDYIKLPPSCLLSNYCSEQERSYVKTDLKPVIHRNYYSEKIIKYLKDEFDNAIPPDRPLKDFFEASEKSFREVRIEVNIKVKDVLLMLERDYSW